MVYLSKSQKAVLVCSKRVSCLYLYEQAREVDLRSLDFVIKYFRTRQFFFFHFHFKEWLNLHILDLWSAWYVHLYSHSLNIYCLFWPAVGCCMHLKAGQKTFCGRFQIFFLLSTIFLLFHLKRIILTVIPRCGKWECIIVPIRQHSWDF